jgi:uncharacterized protein (AIM24 family)
MAVAETLQQFKETETGEAFQLQHGKLLKVELSDVTIQAKAGSMVAYQGDVNFEYAGSGGMGKFLKKAVTGEGTKLMKCSGSGEVFLADFAQEIHIVKLENDKLTVNGANLLAFDAGIEWDIKKVEGVSGVLSGGLYNTELSGSGNIAITSDGPPMLLDIDGSTPTFADPQAAITWSSGVTTSVKASIGIKTLRGGEMVQMQFGGQGWLLVQPSEGKVMAAGGQAGGGNKGMLGNVLGG